MKLKSRIVHTRNTLKREFLRVLLYLAHKRLVKKYLGRNSTRKLQIGCGKNILKGWLNTDINSSSEIIYLDVRRRFPFNDCTFDYVFGEHLIEHLQYLDGERCIRECHRVLMPGGKLRVSTPDLGFLIELYSRKKTKLQERYIIWATKSFLPHIKIYSDIFVINNFFQAWCHKFIYDCMTLRNLMERCGFTDIKRWSLGKSDDKNFQGIELHGQQIPDEFNRLESMVLEATKPL